MQYASMWGSPKLTLQRTIAAPSKDRPLCRHATQWYVQVLRAEVVDHQLLRLRHRRGADSSTSSRIRSRRARMRRRAQHASLTAPAPPSSPRARRTGGRPRPRRRAASGARPRSPGRAARRRSASSSLPRWPAASPIEKRSVSSRSNIRWLSSGKSGSKCAPTTETVPRPRASRSAASSAPGDPAASTTTSAPRPSLAGRDRLGRLLRRERLGAEPRRRLAPRLHAVDREHLRAHVDGAHHGHQPDGSEADDADEVALADAAACDHGVEGRRQVVGEEDGSVVRHRVRQRREHAVGVRHADELGLPAVELRVDARVAEERAARALGDPPGAAGRRDMLVLPSGRPMLASVRRRRELVPITVPSRSRRHPCTGTGRPADRDARRDERVVGSRRGSDSSPVPAEDDGLSGCSISTRNRRVDAEDPAPPHGRSPARGLRRLDDRVSPRACLDTACSRDPATVARRPSPRSVAGRARSS